MLDLDYNQMTNHKLRIHIVCYSCLNVSVYLYEMCCSEIIVSTYNYVSHAYVCLYLFFHDILKVI